MNKLWQISAVIAAGMMLIAFIVAHGVGKFVDACRSVDAAMQKLLDNIFNSEDNTAE